MLPLEFDFSLLDPNAEIENRLFLLERAVNKIEDRLEDAEEISPQRRYHLSVASRLLGVSQSTLKRRAREGKLHIAKDGKKPFVTGAEILRYVRDTS